MLSVQYQPASVLLYIMGMSTQDVEYALPTTYVNQSLAEIKYSE